MINIVLVDDEQLALDELAYLLEKASYVRVIGKFTDAFRALEFCAFEEPDIIYLDINMPGLDGLSFADKLHKLGCKSNIIFATAYEEHALNAFDKGAIDYILKPYEPERILKSLIKFKRNLTVKMEEKSIRKISVTDGDKICFLPIDEVLFFEASNSKVSIYTKHQIYQSNENLSSIEAKLSAEQFVRTHRSYIVNINHVIEASPYFNHTLMIRVQGYKIEIPVSRSYVKKFKALMNFN